MGIIGDRGDAEWRRQRSPGAHRTGWWPTDCDFFLVPFLKKIRVGDGYALHMVEQADADEWMEGLWIWDKLTSHALGRAHVGYAIFFNFLFKRKIIYLARRCL